MIFSHTRNEAKYYYNHSKDVTCIKSFNIFLGLKNDLKLITPNGRASSKCGGSGEICLEVCNTFCPADVVICIHGAIP